MLSIKMMRLNFGLSAGFQTDLSQDSERLLERNHAQAHRDILDLFGELTELTDRSLKKLRWDLHSVLIENRLEDHERTQSNLNIRSKANS